MSSYLSHRTNLVFRPTADELNNAIIKKHRIGSNTKATIKEHVLALHSTTRTGKDVVAGTLQTDGYQLRIHAYSLAKRKKTDKNKNEDKDSYNNDDKNTGSCSTSNRMIRRMTKKKKRYLTEAIPGAATLTQEFGDQKDHVVLAIDPGVEGFFPASCGFRFKVENDLRAFYGSKGLKVASYHKDQGQKAVPSEEC
ncbi:hypothetical protein BGZ65_004284 [Modicella reniformis]|uniref:Uncharacterized protein n=1 Tax=Modicella reniformis TaxID=1440133 RepID=A0A9P6J5R5_9FUNG|nr:hypothetical protein BGZ65_004284 [Modicella reniformis]